MRMEFLIRWLFDGGAELSSLPEVLAHQRNQFGGSAGFSTKHHVQAVVFRLRFRQTADHDYGNSIVSGAQLTHQIGARRSRQQVVSDDHTHAGGER